MEVVVRDETARFCGGPLGTEGEREGWGAAFTAASDTARELEAAGAAKRACLC